MALSSGHLWSDYKGKGAWLVVSNLYSICCVGAAAGGQGNVGQWLVEMEIWFISGEWLFLVLENLLGFSWDKKKRERQIGEERSGGGRWCCLGHEGDRR